MFIDRLMDKEVLLHIHVYSEILFTHKKKCIWISSNEVDEPAVYHTDWSKSEREKQYINAYTWNLERPYWWTYLQGSNGDTDLWEIRLVDTVEEGEGGMNWNIYITIYKIDSNGNWLYDARSSNLVFCDNVEGWNGTGGGRVVQEGKYVYLWLIHVDV